LKKLIFLAVKAGSSFLLKYKLAVFCCALFLVVGLIIGIFVGIQKLNQQNFDASQSLSGARYLWEVEKPADGDSLVVRLVSVDGVDLSQLALTYGVRLIGINAPERGKCGFDEAKAALSGLIDGKQFVLVSGNTKKDTDVYGRLLRYIEIGDLDAGFELLKSGYAVAAYDSQDEKDQYGPHDRESAYRERSAENFRACR
jgi:endonuclease YncB( thermonuclease family)